MSLGDIAAKLPWPVFACNADKHPVVATGFKAASRDPATITAQFSRPGATMIGVPTGIASGFIVIDIDIKSGRDGRAWLTENADVLPPTRTHRTQSGGLHLLFLVPRNIEIRNSASQVAPGVDVRGEGGYVIIPPSPGYAVADTAEIAEIPRWLIRACIRPEPPAPPPRSTEQHERYVQAAISNEVAAVASASEGTRNDTLNKAAVKLGTLVAAGQMSRATAEAELQHAGQAAGLPPRECAQTIKSGLDFGTQRPRDMPTSRHVNGAAAPLKPKRKPLLDWQAEWQLADTGQAIPNLFNTMVTLRHHPVLCELLRFDEMARSAVLVKHIPHTPADHGLPHHVRDADVLAIQEEIQLIGLRRIAKATVQDAVHLRADQGRFHPVKDYLNALTWDRKPRVDTWLSYYLGAEPDEALPDTDKERKRQYFSKIGRLFLISMIARIMQPGCKADYMLILEGPQGALKSSACHILAGDWFSDNLPDLARGDAVRLSMHLRGKWLIEIAEMSSFNAAETHTLKEFLTQTEERYTPKYGRNEVSEPRQCVFVGSTNEATYLRDPTGARRFWPVRVGHIDLEALGQDRDKLLAEAMHLFHAGEHWWPDREFEAEFIAPEQVARYEEDPWHEIIDSWINRNAAVRASVNEILKEILSIPVGQFGTREQRRVSAIFGRMGWISVRSNNKRWFERPVPTRYEQQS